MNKTNDDVGDALTKIGRLYPRIQKPKVLMTGSQAVLSQNRYELVLMTRVTCPGAQA